MKQKSRRKVWITAVVVMALAIGLRLAAEASSSFTEKYLVPVGYYVLMPLKLMISVLPFSLSEVCIVFLLPVSLLIWAGIAIKMKIKKKKISCMKILSTLAVIIAGLYFMYNLALGCPTFREDMNTRFGWEECPSPNQDLIAMTELFAKMSNQERALWGTTGESYSQMNDELVKAFFKTASHYQLKYFYPAFPKRVGLSRLLSYTQTAGIYIPFFAEPNVNVDQPRFTYPFTAAHEMAHSVLVAREKDANMTAFLTCIESESPQVRYSAWFFGMLYSFNALADVNQQELKQIYATLSPQVKHDYIDYSENVKKYEGRIADISQDINDRYIKATGQPEGVLSYGDVVDMMIRWYNHNYA